MILTEAIIGKIIKAAARQAFKGKTLAKQVTKQTGQAPKTLKYKTLYHGTTKKASDAITKGGWKTDVGVTAQRRGTGVYVTPSKRTAIGFAKGKVKQQGGSPALRQFRMRKDVYDHAIRRQAANPKDWANVSGVKQVTMKPEYANKIDVTGKTPPKLDFSGPDFTGNMKTELNQRVRTALRKKQNVDVLKREIRHGNEASVNDLYRRRNNPQNPNTLENELRGRYRGKGTGRKERI